jgi:hypothetical protein
MVTGGKRGLRLSCSGLFRVLQRELVDVERMRSDEHNGLLAVRLVSMQLRNRERKTVVRQLNKTNNHKKQGPKTHFSTANLVGFGTKSADLFPRKNLQLIRGMQQRDSARVHNCNHRLVFVRMHMHQRLQKMRLVVEIHRLAFEALALNEQKVSKTTTSPLLFSLSLETSRRCASMLMVLW